ncbi:MAG: MATE family efflux transporter [Clostridia bacterium]|nr:MATE family efflux transporter [Clostridia bacterium]
MEDRYFYKTYFRLFAVVALQNFLVFGVNLADSVMLGRYGETAMSGVSLANQIQFFVQCFVNGAASGLVVLGAQYWGKKDVASIKKVFSAAFAVGLLIAASIGGAVLAFPAGVLGLLSTEPAIVAAGAGYIRIMGYSYVLFAVSFLLVSLLRSVETVRVGFYACFLALVVNVTLNYVLIFGKLGFPAMGEIGAAWATLASRMAELLFVLFYVFFIDKKVRLRPRDVFTYEGVYFKDFLKAGLPLVGSGGSWGIAMTVQTAVIGRLGAAAIGANAVASPVFQVVAVLYTASSSAASVLIGKTVGENDIPRVRRYTKKLQLIFLVTGAISSAVLFFTRDLIVGLYDLSPDTRAMSVVFINILAFTVFGSAYEAPCLVGIVSGGGDTGFVFRNDLIFMWGIVLPMSFLSAFVFHWPVPVTFAILKADQVLKCFVAVVKVNRYRWIRNLTR